MQNIDALEHLAGLPESHLVEAHGSFKSSYCTVCGTALYTTLYCTVQYRSPV